MKPIQIRYRVWYAILNRIRELTGYSYPDFKSPNTQNLQLAAGVTKPELNKDSEFHFLNHSKIFKRGIDWNFSEYGKLWAYNLNYFDYLHQANISQESGLDLIKNFVNETGKIQFGMEPYPISLRTINWIKFIAQHNISDPEIDASLYRQLKILSKNIEYHVLGNHLLENGCSLLFGALYFRDNDLWEKSRDIITNELNEQILNDGGHYERSVMYHCIILERLIDCYNLLQNNNVFDQIDLKDQIAEIVKKMLGWLVEMQWNNGEVPEVNDHVTEMVPLPSKLFDYAERLNINPAPVILGESGYRAYKNKSYEVLADVGNIGPDYVPGHAHSDIFSFILRIGGQEIISDTGTSTYEDNSQRTTERSTAAHNTLMVEGREQNEVWSAFRVGRRGKVTLLKDHEDDIEAAHDGYQFIGITHQRNFKFEKKGLIIWDLLKKKGAADVSATFHLHFHPNVAITKAGHLIQGSNFEIAFSDNTSIEITDYEKAVGYNKHRSAQKVMVTFINELKTTIRITPS